MSECLNLKLLPCPFCGSIPEWDIDPTDFFILPAGEKQIIQWRATINCTGCGVASCTEQGEVGTEGSSAGAAIRAAMNALNRWNRRTT